MILFPPLFHVFLFSSSIIAGCFSFRSNFLPHLGGSVRVSINVDDNFKFFADDELIAMGDHYNEVYSFYYDHLSQIRVEAAEAKSEAKNQRGIILSTSLGLVTNSSWRCIENNGSALPDPSQWPFAETLDSNDANSHVWPVRPEIHPNASWIWAPKLPSGLYPPKVACAPSPIPVKCVDNGCEKEFDGQGVCVDFRTSANVNFSSLATQFDLLAGSKSGLCGYNQQQEGKAESCCHCLRKTYPELRTTSKPYSKVIALGGETVNGSTNVVEQLRRSNETSSDWDLPVARYGHSAFILPNTTDILVCGGETLHHGKDKLRDCIVSTKSTTSTWAWASHSTLTEPRSNAATVVMPSGDVYILGGEFSPDTSDVLRSGNQTWTNGPKLNQPANDACAVAINATSFVTIGGVVEQDISLYNTDTGAWSKPWPMLAEGRRGHSCARVHDKVIVAGGYLYTTHENTATMLIIDINTGEALASASMNEARSHFSMHGFHNGMVVAIGGNVLWKANNDTVSTRFSNTLEVREKNPDI